MLENQWVLQVAVETSTSSGCRSKKTQRVFKNHGRLVKKLLGTLGREGVIVLIGGWGGGVWGGGGYQTFGVCRSLENGVPARDITYVNMSVLKEVRRAGGNGQREQRKRIPVRFSRLGRR